MAKKIRVENNSVVECMNADEVPAGAMDTGDWRDAVEVEPQLIPYRQILGSHWFDLTKNPVEIRWNVEDLSVDDRKNDLLFGIDYRYKSVLSGIAANANDINESTQAFIQAMLDKQGEKDAVNAFTTHEQIDEYMTENGLM